MSTRALSLMVLAILAISIAIPAFAVHGGDVIIGQQLVLRIRFPAGGMTIQERADAVTLRINQLLGSEPFDPSKVTVGREGGDYVVLYRDNLIITADPQSARANKTTPKALAEIWAANLRRVVPSAKALSVQQ